MDIERRREQNRAAQRRFRERQRSAAVAEQAQSRMASNSSPARGSTTSPTSQKQNRPESYGQNPSPDNAVNPVPSARFSGSSVNPTPVDTPRSCSSFNFYGANLLLDNIELLDMDNDGMSDADTFSNSLQGQHFADIIEELAYADNHSSDRIHISDRAILYTKGKEHEKHGGTLQQTQPHGSDSSISNREEGTTEPGTTGWLTPLHVAAQKGRDKIVRTLLQHNADCNAKDSDSLTPLAHAAMGGHKEVVALLLSHGARISEVDDQRRTVLHWAVMRQREGVLKILLEHCGREHPVIDKYDKTGRAPVHIAIETDFEEGLRLLLQFGANVHSKVRKGTSEF
ncbi:Ankyrin repeat domain-containing protein 27 [Cytospora mali]|uniref:Ankyrin repeat domain-containing protein 27 n=1 Tax=Cytospora mali TaxID=578113 RepID=A0A194VM42_CYTMA|nr:Ankyrin repeat domain-containing protein 27 [Valsa mali]